MKFSRMIMAAMAAFMAMLAEMTIAAEYSFVGTSQLWNVGLTEITNANMWSSHEMPSAGNTYVIAGTSSAARYCGLGITTGSFPGDSLKVGKYGNLVLKPASTTVKSYEFPGDGLYLEGGSVYAASAWNKYVLAGRVTVANDTVNNLYATGGSTFGIDFTGAFVGGSGATLRVMGQNDTLNGTYNVSFLGNMSGYTGSILVGGATKYWARALFGTPDTVGSVDVKTTGAIGPCGEGVGLGECAIWDLVLASGATLKLSVNATTNGIVRVTHSLTMPESGKVKLDLTTYRSSASDQYGVGMKRLLLTAPLGTGLDSGSFEVLLPSAFPAWIKALRSSLIVETTESEERLYWFVRKNHSLVTNDGYTESAFLPDYASHWSGHSTGDTLDTNDFYVVANSKGINTPRGSGIVAFGGWGLFIQAGGGFAMNQSVKIDRLYLNPGAKFVMGPTAMTVVLQGTVTFIDTENAGGYTAIWGVDQRTYDIQSELRGGSGLTLTTTASSGYYGNGNPVFVLNGTNTAFSGKIRVSNATPPTYMTTLKVSDGRNLGGEMAAFTYDGVELRAGSRLVATAPLVLTETTRGLFVNGSGRIRVQNATDEMAVRSRLTMAGTLVKEGPGVLAFGGSACRFTAEQSETPVAGTNVLEVSAGRIKALSKEAFQGLAIKFAASTGIEIPMPSEVDADTLQYGLCNTVWSTPFDLTDCGGRLSVGVHDVTAVPDKADIAICTVSSSVAASLRGKIDFVRVQHHAVGIRERDNGDGTVTFVARIRANPETMIIVR